MPVLAERPVCLWGSLAGRVDKDFTDVNVTQSWTGPISGSFEAPLEYRLPDWFEADHTRPTSFLCLAFAEWIS